MTYKETLPVWWSFTWRALIASFAAGALVGAVIGFIAGLLQLGANVAAIGGGIGGLLVVIPVGVWALRAALLKNGFAKVA